jgi:hypothetical protein
MFRSNWRDPRFWRWWWHERVTFESRIAAYVFLFAVLLGSGLFAADRLASAGAEVSPSTPILIETTVQKLVTIREQGKVVRKLVPVVKRIRVKSRPTIETRTAVALRTITTPGGVRVVSHVVYKPVVKKQVVTVAGKTRTVSVRRLVPTVQTRTQTLTQVQTVTGPGATVTTEGPTRTVENTPPTRTVQGPTTTQVSTVTNTQTQTLTQTQTQTVTSTQTVTTPADPVTVTVPTTTTITITVTLPAP